MLTFSVSSWPVQAFVRSTFSKKKEKKNTKINTVKISLVSGVQNVSIPMNMHVMYLVIECA